jgi:hypothetical protein
VRDAELEADQDGGRQRGEPDEVAPARDERHRDGEQHGADLDGGLGGRPAAQPPDAERRAA